jgi:hypothetical protein
VSEALDELIVALQEDTSKLRGMAAGNRELEAVAQVLSRVTAALSAIEQRLQLLPAPPGSEAMVPMEPVARDDCTTLC